MRTPLRQSSITSASALPLLLLLLLLLLVGSCHVAAAADPRTHFNNIDLAEATSRLHSFRRQVHAGDVTEPRQRAFSPLADDEPAHFLVQVRADADVQRSPSQSALHRVQTALGTSDAHHATTDGHIIVFTTLRELRESLAASGGVRDIWELPAEMKMHRRVAEIVAAAGTACAKTFDASGGGRQRRTLFVKVAAAVAASVEGRLAIEQIVQQQQDQQPQQSEAGADDQATSTPCAVRSLSWSAHGSPTLRISFSSLCACSDTIARLAHHQSVRWLELAPRFESQNAIATTTLQSAVRTDRPIWAKGITGSGQLIGVGDTGLDYDSCFFRDDAQQVAFYPQTNPKHRKVLSYHECVDDDGNREHRDLVNAHGTHVAGSVAGKSLGDKTDYNGLAPDAKIFFHDLTCGSDSDGLYLPGDLYDFYVPQYAAGARIGSNSWGSDSPKEYGAVDRETDRFLYIHSDYLAIFAAGNSAYAGILSPSAAKNVLTVGAHMNTLVASSRGTIASFSAHGPTFDKRIKPELAAPGSPVQSAHSDGIFNSNQCSLESKSGTSMATPFVSASAALMRQYLQEGFYPGGTRNASASVTPSGALLKALLIHATKPMENVDPPATPNGIEGFGRLELERVFLFDDSSSSSSSATSVKVWFADQSAVEQDGVFWRCFAYERAGAGSEFRATLVWMDPPLAAEGSHTSVVNDLDISLVDSNGMLRLPNGGAVQRGQVVEQVKVDSGLLPSTNRYMQLHIFGFTVDGERDETNSSAPPRQSFSVVVSAPGLVEVDNAKCSAPSRPCPSSCSGHGKCVNGRCSCNPGYYTIDCSVCNSRTVCNGNGQCEASTGKCTCDRNIAASSPDCSTCAAGFYGPHCQGTCACGSHGACDFVSGVCNCMHVPASGFWDGERCDKCAVDHRDTATSCKTQSFWCVNKQVRVIADANETGFIQINDWGAYRNSQQCMWHIVAAHPSWRIRLTFETIDVEEPYDVITVHQGSSDQAPALAKLTGKRSDVEVKTTSAELFVKFQADYVGPGVGFLARFDVIRQCGPTTCNGHGACNAEGSCTCERNFDPAEFCMACVAGWSGATCHEPVTVTPAPVATPTPTTDSCATPTTSDPLGVCSGHGHCNTARTGCVCDVLFTGRLCADRCPVINVGGGPEGNVLPCSGRGRCTVDGCICDDPWRHAGRACQVVRGALLNLHTKQTIARITSPATSAWQFGTYTLAAPSADAAASAKAVHPTVRLTLRSVLTSSSAPAAFRLAIWDGEAQVGALSEARFSIDTDPNGVICLDITGWRPDTYFGVLDTAVRPAAAAAANGTSSSPLRFAIIAVSELQPRAADPGVDCETRICDVLSCASELVVGASDAASVLNATPVTDQSDRGIVWNLQQDAKTAIKYHPAVAAACAVGGFVAAVLCIAVGKLALTRSETVRRHVERRKYATLDSETGGGGRRGERRASVGSVDDSDEASDVDLAPVVSVTSKAGQKPTPNDIATAAVATLPPFSTNRATTSAGEPTAKADDDAMHSP